MERIFNDYGIEILRTKTGAKILRYDAGEIVSQTEDIMVTDEEAIKAMRSVFGAASIILHYQNKYSKKYRKTVRSYM